MATTSNHYLILRADGEARLTKRFPRQIGADEVAVRVKVTWPESWGRMIKTIEVGMPGPPTIDDTEVVPREEETK